VHDARPFWRLQISSFWQWKLRRGDYAPQRTARHELLAAGDRSETGQPVSVTKPDQGYRIVINGRSLIVGS
jgi:hypothetical protein